MDQGAGVGVLSENCCDAGVGVTLPLCDDAGVLARLTGAGVWPEYPNPYSQPGVAAEIWPGFGVSDWRLQFGDHGVCSWSWDSILCSGILYGLVAIRYKSTGVYLLGSIHKLRLDLLITYIGHIVHLPVTDGRTLSAL